MNTIWLENLWNSHNQAFLAAPNDHDQQACERIAIALCDVAMNRKPKPQRLLEIALSHLGVDLKTGPEPGPDAETLIERLVYSVWTSIQNSSYQVVHTDNEDIYVYSIDRDGQIVRVSQAWADKLGYHPDEMLGKKSIDFLTSESQKTALDVNLPLFFERGWIMGAHYDAVTKNGAIIPITINATSEIDENGNVLKSMAVVTLR